MKIIIFKFILIGIKQNLGLEFSKFYFRGLKKKIIYNFWFLARSGGSFEPLGWL